MKTFFRDRGLGVVLLVLFLASWGFQAWTGWEKYQSEQASHEASASVFGSNGYIWEFGEATFENWQSEFLQLLAFVTLTSFLIFRGSPESKEGQEEMMAMLKRIEERLSAAEAVTPTAPAIGRQAS
jgi:hypothetical protein